MSSHNPQRISCVLSETLGRIFMVIEFITRNLWHVLRLPFPPNYACYTFDMKLGFFLPISPCRWFSFSATWMSSYWDILISLPISLQFIHKLCEPVVSLNYMCYFCPNPVCVTLSMSWFLHTVESQFVKVLGTEGKASKNGNFDG